MKSLKSDLNSAKIFFKNWRTFLILFLTLHIVINVFAIAGIGLLAQLIINISHIPYIGYDNILSIILTKPIAFICLLALLLLILALVYFQFAFTFIGIDKLRHHESQTIFQIMGQSIKRLRYVKPSAIPFFLLYFILILPLSNTILNSALLNKVKVPTFIEDFIFTNASLAIPYIILNLVIVYISIRFIQIFPFIFIKGFTLKQAIKASWINTRHRFWSISFRILWTAIFTIIIKWLAVGTIVFCQYLIDGHTNNQISLYFAIGNLSILSFVNLIISIFSSVLYILIILRDFYSSENINLDNLSLKANIKLSNKRRSISILMVTILALSSFAISSTKNAIFIFRAANNKPLLISHRGVDGDNGVQNTIPVLKKTAKLKPDYVEMDIHETKDHQFVVMHDANLKVLAGINKSPYQLTLNELKNITIHENGYTAKIASFDDYYKEARKLKQHLLIEIKTTNHDSKDMLDIFIKKYGNTIIKNKDRVHSLDYNVVSGLKKKDPKIFVSFIMPYNLVFPQTSANAYTMEESTLDSDFILGSNLENKSVYAWTVDSENDMERMQFIGADGIITDNLTDLKDNIKENNKQTSYADRILQYAVQGSILSTTSSVPEN